MLVITLPKKLGVFIMIKKKTKGIYGRVTAEEIDELKEEGIETTTIPWYDKTEN